VALRRPICSCIRIASLIAASSIERSSSPSIRPASCSARAESSSGGRSRLPTWSARNGGASRRLTGGHASGAL